MSVLMPLRVILFYLLLAASAGIWGVLMLIITPFIPSAKLRSKLIISWWSRMAIWLTKHLVGIDYEVIGRENIPDQPGVILANHQSTWETFFLQQVFQPQTQLIKKELLYVPFFGWAFALAKPIAIDRKNGRDSLKQLSLIGGKRLAEGFWILVFPEGTRMLPGTTIKFSRGGTALACATQAPVIPVAHNAGEFWPKHGWGKKPGTVTVMIGPALYPKGPDPRSIVELNKRAEEWINQAMLDINQR